MKIPRRRGPAVVVVLILVLFGSPVRAGQGTPQTIVLEGRRLTAYKSLCDVEPKESPGTTFLMQPGAGWKFTAGCRDLDTKRLVPLVLTFKNSNARQATKFTIPLLSEVIQQTPRGMESAAALYIVFGGRRGFATEIHGRIDIDLPPGAAIELLYLLPSASGDSKASVRGYGTVKIVR